MNSEKVCLTSFVYGIKYQAFIPYLVYSCHKAYPEYDIQLFLYDELEDSIRRQLKLIGSENVVIHEKHFNECKTMKPVKAQSLRWVLWDDSFTKYDYIYIVDIDMFYIREPKLLHVQHVEHMATTGLCFDNLVRKGYRHPFSKAGLGSRLKRAGLRNILGFLFGPREFFRLSGLHFIKVDPYYKVFTKEYREKFTRMIFDNSFMNKVLSSNDEAYLYYILKECGLHPEKLCVMNGSTTMLDFNNTTRSEFRPHHGLHMGIFRCNIDDNFRSILESSAYKYYVREFEKKHFHDSLFWQIFEMSPSNIKEQFNNMFDYYNLKR